MDSAAALEAGVLVVDHHHKVVRINYTLLPPEAPKSPGAATGSVPAVGQGPLVAVTPAKE